MNTEEKNIKIAIEEINNPTWGIVKQFLGVHKVVLDDGQPCVAGFGKQDDDAIVYFYVENERFYLAILVNTKENAINGCYVEPYCSIALRASSEIIDLTELKSMIVLKPTREYAKGDIKLKTLTYKENFIEFSLPVKPMSFGKKMDKFLSYIEQDKSGVQRLAKEANAYVQVCIEFYNGNGALGGMGIDKKLINKLSELGLDIDFDLYAFGNPYND